jgi:hypothetical protein
MLQYPQYASMRASLATVCAIHLRTLTQKPAPESAPLLPLPLLARPVRLGGRDRRPQRRL